MVRDFLWAGDATLLKLHVELMNSTGVNFLTENTRRQIEQLVLSLLREVNEGRPLGFDLIRRFSETATLINTRM